MADIMSRAQRTRMMQAIKSHGTQPELFLRKYLHAQGYRYRLHRKGLPGTPDLVLPRYSLAIFVHGCFWHRHAQCFYATTPATRKSFWLEKLEANSRRDQRSYEALRLQGWRVLVVWECGLKHCREQLPSVMQAIEAVNQYQEWPFQPPRQRKETPDS